MDGQGRRACIYTFIAEPNHRVKLDFNQFQLAGTSDNCDIEYIDIYSELTGPEDDLLRQPLGGRYCGSVSPHVRISLYNVLVLVLHSRADNRRDALKFHGTYEFIPASRFVVGTPLAPGKCGFEIQSKHKKKGTVISPTYPGTYPKNFTCIYIFRGRPGQRIYLFFRDFDIYFGGEHCPYDAVTVYDGLTNRDTIIRKVCGLQQKMEIYSLTEHLFLEFNTTNPPRADHRGFVIEYEFSSRFVDVAKLIDGQSGVTHMRGTECDVRVESNRETQHIISSPNYPQYYPLNTSCTYILDGLQGAQNLERVILTFLHFAVFSEDEMDTEDGVCSDSYVGVAATSGTIKATLGDGESSYDVQLCTRYPPGDEKLSPIMSDGPRMVIVFSSDDQRINDNQHPLGFRASVQFRTDFGIPGLPVGDSNKCQFMFNQPAGFFNSPRYPSSYPLDTNCTYYIKGRRGQKVITYFEQFALHQGLSQADLCGDWLEIHDVITEPDGRESTKLKSRYCAGALPGPTVSAWHSHEMRVIFHSDHHGTATGFKAFYELRNAPAEDIPTSPRGRCGGRVGGSGKTAGWIASPGFPNKYNKDLICNWEIGVRKGYMVLLNPYHLEVEGEMTALGANCQNAVIRIDSDMTNTDAADGIEFCGTDPGKISPILSKSNIMRLSFLTSPDKVNGLKGFNFTWTEVRLVSDEETCTSSGMYKCTYSKFCIDESLRCNGIPNCGLHDNTDEAHCNVEESGTDVRTLMLAAAAAGLVILVSLIVLCFVLKKKFGKKKKRHHHQQRQQRQPFRPHSTSQTRRPHTSSHDEIEYK
uniref:CUB domain-containing protein n=1 Tax=Plectus sambesii TaxID=2011161 RepID=A0A914XS65_9BILA